MTESGIRVERTTDKTSIDFFYIWKSWRIPEIQFKRTRRKKCTEMVELEKNIFPDLCHGSSFWGIIHFLLNKSENLVSGELPPGQLAPDNYLLDKCPLNNYFHRTTATRTIAAINKKLRESTTWVGGINNNKTNEGFIFLFYPLRRITQ